MTEDELYAHFFGSRMFQQWHWFRWHFEHRLRGEDHPLARDIVRALLDCDRHLPGFAKGMCEELAAISGREKHKPHWEQLLQRLAEIHVIRQAVTFDWSPPASFSWEPRLAKGGKNPELAIELTDLKLGVEVKAPSLFEHVAKRSTNPQQIPARFAPREMLDQLAGDGATTLPRDNPIKDFLVSADGKFSAFRASDERFRGVLVVVWDDFIFEPISSLLHPTAGLFTEKTFHRTDDDRPITFPNVDAVVIIRHLHQLFRACRDEPFVDSCGWTFDYGEFDIFPFKALVQNSAGKEVPSSALKFLQARVPDPSLGAEYTPKDMVWWFGDDS